MRGCARDVPGGQGGHRAVGRPGRGGLGRRGAALRVHGHRRPGQRRLAPVRAGQDARTAGCSPRRRSSPARATTSASAGSSARPRSCAGAARRRAWPGRARRYRRCAVKRQINALLEQARLPCSRTSRRRRRRRAPRSRVPYRVADPRLLKEPAFVLSTVRSGSTLLRMLLDSHSQIHSPHEMHLRVDRGGGRRQVRRQGAGRGQARPRRARQRAVGLVPAPRARHHRQAAARQQDAQRRLHRRPHPGLLARRALHLPAAPPARRSPARAHKLRPQDTAEQNYGRVLKYAEAVEAARQTLPRPHGPLRGPHRRPRGRD